MVSKEKVYVYTNQLLFYLLFLLLCADQLTFSLSDKIRRGEERRGEEKREEKRRDTSCSGNGRRHHVGWRFFKRVFEKATFEDQIKKKRRRETSSELEMERLVGKVGGT